MRVGRTVFYGRVQAVIRGPRLMRPAEFRLFLLAYRWFALRDATRICNNDIGVADILRSRLATTRVKTRWDSKEIIETPRRSQKQHQETDMLASFFCGGYAASTHLSIARTWRFTMLRRPLITLLGIFEPLCPCDLARRGAFPRITR